MHELKTVVSSVRVRWVATGLLLILIELLIFHAGVVVGSHRHARSEGRGWGFRGPGFAVQMPHGSIQDGHGVVGVVQSVATSSVVVLARDGSVKMVMLDAQTVIRDRSGNASTTALSRGMHVIVLGVPNGDGTVSGDIIRIVDTGAPPSSGMRP